MWENKVRKTQLSLEVMEDWKYETKNYWEKSICSNVSSSALVVKTVEYNSVCACVYMCVYVICFARSPC
jgi:hypothetical protein